MGACLVQMNVQMGGKVPMWIRDRVKQTQDYMPSPQIEGMGSIGRSARVARADF